MSEEAVEVPYVQSTKPIHGVWAATVREGIRSKHESAQLCRGPSRVAWSMSAPKPTNVVLVTDRGDRVPVELRYAGDPQEVHIWEPVIEGELADIMIDVVAIDADTWPAGAGLQLPAGPGYDTIEWGLAVLKNSPILSGYLAG
jgi:hypothetical protein